MTIHGDFFCKETNRECENIKKMHDVLGLAMVEQGSLYIQAGRLKEALEKIDAISKETLAGKKTVNLSEKPLAKALATITLGILVGIFASCAWNPFGLMLILSGFLVGLSFGIIIFSRR